MVLTDVHFTDKVVVVRVIVFINRNQLFLWDHWPLWLRLLGVLLRYEERSSLRRVGDLVSVCNCAALFNQLVHERAS